jgi:hypothetical protein
VREVGLQRALHQQRANGFGRRWLLRALFGRGRHRQRDTGGRHRLHELGLRLLNRLVCRVNFPLALDALRLQLLAQLLVLRRGDFDPVGVAHAQFAGFHLVARLAQVRLHQHHNALGVRELAVNNQRRIEERIRLQRHVPERRGVGVRLNQRTGREDPVHAGYSGRHACLPLHCFRDSAVGLAGRRRGRR